MELEEPDLIFEGPITLDACRKLTCQLSECYLEIEALSKESSLHPTWISCMMQWSQNLLEAKARTLEAEFNTHLVALLKMPDMTDQQIIDVLRIKCPFEMDEQYVQTLIDKVRAIPEAFEAYNRKILSIAMCIVRDFNAGKSTNFIEKATEIRSMKVGSGRMDDVKCPNCNIVHDAYTGVSDEGKEIKPSSGDYVVCSSCGQINEFDENLQLIKSENWQNCDKETVILLEGIQKMTLEKIAKDKKFMFYRPSE